MTEKIKRKAKLLLIELESLRDYKGNHTTIEKFALLEEVLKDADCLAKQVNNNMPGCLLQRSEDIKQECARIKNRWNDASQRSKQAMARSQALLERYNQVKKVA